MAVAGGVVLALASPGLDLWWCAWLGLAPLLILIRACKTVGEAGVLGFVFGLAYHLVSLRWILDLKPADAAAGPVWALGVGQLWGVVAVHQSVLYLAFACLVFALPLRSGNLPHYHRPFFPYIWSVPIIWLFMMWVLAPADFFGGLPLAQLAYTQGPLLQLLQVARFGGSQLIDLILILSNCAVAQLIIEVTHLSPPYANRIDFFPPRTGAAFDLAWILGLAALACFWGTGELQNSWLLPDDQVAGYAAPPITVAVVQPDYAKSRQPEVLFKPAQNLGVNMIFLPQLPAVGTREYRRLLRQLAITERKDVVAGLRETTDNGGVVQTIRVFSAAGKSDANNFTSKCKLMPFFDFPPWYALLVSGAVQKVLAPDPDESARAEQPNILQTTPAKIGALFFNEILYPEFVARQAERGTALLVHVTDLTAFKSDTLAKQLLAAGQLRAIETGRYIVMSEGGATSAVIDPLGVRRCTTIFAPGKAGCLIDRVQFTPKKTRFTSWWWIWTPFYRMLSKR